MSAGEKRVLSGTDRGFVVLLLVMALVPLLAVPAARIVLRRIDARETARRATCKRSLRSISPAILTYAECDDEVFPGVEPIAE